MLKDQEPDEVQPTSNRHISLLDLVTLGMIGLTLVVAGWVLMVLREPYGPFNPFPPPLPPTEVTIVPYAPLAETLPAWSAAPTKTPSATYTLVATATHTPFITQTPTPLPRRTATPAISPSAYRFTLAGNAVGYGTNNNPEGCDWQSIAGQVVGLDGEPVEGLYVQITGEGIDEAVVTGSAPEFGPSGYELVLGNTPRRGTYVVQLISQSGEALSDKIIVETIDRCEQNVALVNFEQSP